MPSSVKLPEIEMSLFDGNKMDWAEFWNLFKVTVDQDVCLSDIEKICYLKNMHERVGVYDSMLSLML